MKIFEFRNQLMVPRPRHQVFSFFSDAQNLEQLTPPWLQFHIVSQLPIAMRAGAQIDYRLKLRGIPLRWRSRITTWEPPYRFVDEQVRGPYRLWIHEHRFLEDPHGTLCEDYVRYAVCGGALADKLLVARDVRTIFDFRSRRLEDIFAAKP